ncbi:MAG: hypothetical protein ACRDG3_04815 [Tepidiformaceae bacterium]
MGRLIFAAMLLGPLLLAACGGGGLAAPLPCATPSATATARPGSFGGGRFQDYLLAIRPQLDQLQSLENQFLLDHTSHTFSTDASFRPGVAAFIDQSVCVATTLQGISPPGAQQFAKAAADEQSALAAYVAHLQAGRTAVVTRNVTNYRTFYDNLQTKFDAIQKAYQNPVR